MLVVRSDRGPTSSSSTSGAFSWAFSLAMRHAAREQTEHPQMRGVLPKLEAAWLFLLSEITIPQSDLNGGFFHPLLNAFLPQFIDLRGTSACSRSQRRIPVACSCSLRDPASGSRPSTPARNMDWERARAMSTRGRTDVKRT